MQGAEGEAFKNANNNSGDMYHEKEVREKVRKIRRGRKEIEEGGGVFGPSGDSFMCAGDPGKAGS